jgi:hypothetical protein
MIKYEYATVPLLSHATKQILDTWGSDGWELVQVIPAPGTGEQLVAYISSNYCSSSSHWCNRSLFLHEVRLIRK